MKTVTLLFFLAALTLAVSHSLALSMYLYWRYPWLDIPMHTLGGATVALGYLTFFEFYPPLADRYIRFVPALLLVLVVALSWEVFEVLIGVSLEEPNYLADTVLDVCCGLAGGALGYAVGSRLYRLKL